MPQRVCRRGSVILVVVGGLCVSLRRVEIWRCGGWRLRQMRLVVCLIDGGRVSLNGLYASLL
jgi:hypothetical protein